MGGQRSSDRVQRRKSADPTEKAEGVGTKATGRISYTVCEAPAEGNGEAPCSNFKMESTEH